MKDDIKIRKVGVETTHFVRGSDQFRNFDGDVYDEVQEKYMAITECDPPIVGLGDTISEAVEDWIANSYLDKIE